MQSIKRMVTTLIDNPAVLGLLEYGSSSAGDAQIPGDYDLLVILNNKTPKVESLHFYVDGIPVDLNLRTLDEIHKLARATGFDRILLDGRIIYDPSGSLTQEIQDLKERDRLALPDQPSVETITFTRHGAKHIIDKVKGRIDSDPTLCAFLLNQNVY